MADKSISPVRNMWQQLITWASDYPILTAALLIAVFSGFFVAFPGADLWLSELYYWRPGGFLLKDLDVLHWLRDFGFFLGVALILWLVLQLVMKLVHPRQQSYIPPNVTLFLLSTVIVGPGLIVNILFKNHWGRPRPRDLEQFGGNLPFIEAWHYTDYCASNCSFVSGEASFAFWMTAFALVVPRAYRFSVALFTIALAILLSFNRIAFGGHFLSDVAISAAITLLVIAIGYRLFITHPPPWLTKDRLEADLTRLGIWLEFGRGNR